METTFTAHQAGVSVFRGHWPEYLGEAAGLALFMISACVFTVAFEYPDSAVHQAVPNAVIRRILTGIAMGLTNVALIYSPWGQRSGAHMNPGVTLAFLTLGKVQARDAVFYVVFQFAGGISGVLASRWLLGIPVEHRAVHYAATVPGGLGTAAAFWAELLISALLMATVLIVSNAARLARFTPLFASTLLAAYIALESPLSGTSMNPARTLGSNVPAHEWMALWIYFTAPPIGMLLAAQVYRLRRGTHHVFCAKLHHHNNKRCIFRCNYRAM